MVSHYSVLGLYRKVDTFVRAAEQVRGEFGLADGEIEALTSAAFPDGALLEDATLAHQVDKKQFLFPFLLGITGLLLGSSLAGGTGYIMNLDVGGKDPFSYAPTGIITYEFTLLFAVIGSVLSLLYYTGLPNWKERAYDPDITCGALGLLIKVRSREEQERAAALMQRLGAYKIRKGENDF